MIDNVVKCCYYICFKIFNEVFYEIILPSKSFVFIKFWPINSDVNEMKALSFQEKQVEKLLYYQLLEFSERPLAFVRRLTLNLKSKYFFSRGIPFISFLSVAATVFLSGIQLHLFPLIIKIFSASELLSCLLGCI